MVNAQHVAITKKGAEAIEKWRLNNKNKILDLSYADLSEADLSNANLEKAVFFAADLSYTDVSEARLAKADFAFSLLLGTDFSGADLSRACLGYAHIKYPIFSNTNLSRSDLTGATLCGPTFESKPANLKDAIMRDTVLVDCDMNDFANLDTVKHKGPSHIDIDTLISSYLKSDKFEEELEPFFLEAGVPKSLLDSLPEIVKGIMYCNCFVCYGEPDKAFAEKLVNDLKAEEIGCWIYSMDATPGKRIWPEITQKRRELDKMIVLCSIKSLYREGVKKEIEEQIDEDPEKMVLISLDNLWREEAFLVKRGQRDLKPHLIECTYADFSDPSKYDKSFRRLLKALKKPKK